MRNIIETEWRRLLTAEPVIEDGYIAACYIGGEYAERGPYSTIEKVYEVGIREFPIFEVIEVNGGQRRVIEPHVRGYAFNESKT